MLSNQCKTTQNILHDYFSVINAYQVLTKLENNLSSTGIS